MCIFQCEQGIKSINALFSLKKTNGHQICKFKIHVYCVARHRYSVRDLTPKPSNIAKLKTALPCYRYRMICHRSSVIRQSCHFKRLDFRVLLQLVDVLNRTFSLNTERAADIIETSEMLTQNCAKFNSLITEYSGHNSTFT